MYTYFQPRMSIEQEEVDIKEALDKLRQHTRNYAKRQLTWFRKNPNLEINC